MPLRSFLLVPRWDYRLVYIANTSMLLARWFSRRRIKSWLLGGGSFVANLSVLVLLYIFFIAVLFLAGGLLVTVMYVDWARLEGG
jgi:hypothetical protein